jgi:hypothetical protein
LNTSITDCTVAAKPNSANTVKNAKTSIFIINIVFLICEVAGFEPAWCLLLPRGLVHEGLKSYLKHRKKKGPVAPCLRACIAYQAPIPQLHWTTEVAATTK